MFDKISKFMDYVAAIEAVTPTVIEDVQKLVADLKQTHLFGATGTIPNVEILVATMQQGNERVQKAPRFLCNDLAKQVSQAVTDVVTEDETIASAILAKL